MPKQITVKTVEHLMERVFRERSSMYLSFTVLRTVDDFDVTYKLTLYKRGKERQIVDEYSGTFIRPIMTGVDNWIFQTARSLGWDIEQRARRKAVTIMDSFLVGTYLNRNRRTSMTCRGCQFEMLVFPDTNAQEQQLQLTTKEYVPAGVFDGVSVDVRSVHGPGTKVNTEEFMDYFKYEFTGVKSEPSTLAYSTPTSDKSIAVNKS